MKFCELEKLVQPFRELEVTAAESHVQSKKCLHIAVTKIEELFLELAVVHEQFSQLKKEHYGKRKNTELSDSSNPDQDTPDERESNKTARDRERAAKKKLAAAKLKTKPAPTGKTKTQQVRHRIPSGLICKCCGTEIVDQGLCQRANETDLVLSKIIEREYLLHRGRCSCGEIDFVMPRPSRALEGRVYTSNFLAKLIVDKFRYHLPIYRQTKQLDDLGLSLSRNVLNEALLACWNEFKPIVKLMWELNRKQQYRYVDETPICRVVDKKVSKRYYLWGMVTELAITLELTKSRNQKEARRIIGPGGNVLTDALSIYCANSIDGVHANCLAHLMQYFFKAFSSFPGECEQAIEILVEVYDLDRDSTLAGHNPEQKTEFRKENIKPVMERLLSKLKSFNPPPRSSLGKAIQYFCSHWSELTAFLSDGNIKLDNNRIESIFKDVKLGMKNCLFVQSDVGGEALAGFFSLIATCEMHGINPFSYLATTLDRIAQGWPRNRLDELLPWNFKSPETQEQDLSDYREVSPPASEILKKLGLEEKVTIKSDLGLKPRTGPPLPCSSATNSRIH